MCKVIQLFQPNRAPAPAGAIKQCGTVIPLIHTKQAKAQGVFAEIVMAAGRMGVKDHLAVQFAQRARDDYNRGGRSPARVIADWKAALREITRKVQA